MRLIGARTNATVSGADELPGKTNYFIGRDPAKWQTGVPTYAKVIHGDVYPGVDLIYYGNERGQLEFDFVVAPGVDPGAIAFDAQGRERGPARLDETGGLVVRTDEGDIRLEKPVVYQQDSNGRRVSVEGRYQLAKGGSVVSFDIGAYDRSRPLVIDPVLTYSTFLNAAGVNDVTLDTDGNAYVAGAGFVAKLNAAGTSRDYITYFNANVVSIALDASNNAYVTGYTEATDLPTTAGAFQPASAGRADSFVIKLNAAGDAVVYATYLGGNWFEFGRGIAVDSGGSAYVTTTGGVFDGFPVTAGAFMTTIGCCGDHGAVTKLNATGTALIYSTFLGGSGVDGIEGIAIDAAGNAYVTGHTGSANFPTTAGAIQTVHANTSFRDAYVTVLNANGNGLIFSTLLGGTLGDQGHGIALDGSGNVWIAGWTSSSDFPTTLGALQPAIGGPQNVFVAKVSVGDRLLLGSTYLGGAGVDYVGSRLAVDSLGSLWVGGYTSSSTFPTTPDAFQATFGGGATDGYVAGVNSTTTALVYSTLLGGAGEDFSGAVTIDSSNNVYVAGTSTSSGFPSTPGTFHPVKTLAVDGFLMKFGTDSEAPTIDCGAVDTNWHATDAAIACTASDSGTGLANEDDASFSLSTSVPAGVETSNAFTDSRVVCDNAGNCATAGPIAYNMIDKLAPTIAITAPTAAAVVLNQTVAADFYCTDNGSGVSSCVGTTASGASINTSTPGSHTFMVTATDAVGNTTMTTRTYTVTYGLCVQFDQTKAHKSGSTVPIKLQLCDSSGANVSSAAVELVATGVYLVSTNAPGALEDSGYANPDSQFRFDTDRYVFNLSTNGLGQGTYMLVFTAGADPTPHSVLFQVR